MNKDDLTQWVLDNVPDEDALLMLGIITKKGENAINDSTFRSMVRNTMGGMKLLKDATPTSEKLKAELKGYDTVLTNAEIADLAIQYGVSADDVKKVITEMNREKEESEYAKRKESLKNEQESRKKDLEDYSSWTKAWKGESWQGHSFPARMALATGMKLIPDISKDKYVETGKSDAATDFIGGASEAASFVPGVGKGIGLGVKKVMPKAIQYTTRALQYGADPTLRAVHSNQDIGDAVGSAVAGTVTNAGIDNIPFKVIGDIAKGWTGQIGEKMFGKKIEKAAMEMDKSRLLENKAAIDEKLLKDFGIDYSKTPKGMSKRDYAFGQMRNWVDKHSDDPLAIQNKADELIAAGYPKEAEYILQSDWLNMPYSPARPNDYIGGIGFIGNPRKAKELTRGSNIPLNDEKIVQNIRQRPYINQRIILEDMMAKKPSKKAEYVGAMLRGAMKTKLRKSPEHKGVQPDELIKRQWEAGFIPTKGTPEYKEYLKWRNEQ